MGIDLYLMWDGQTDEEHSAQITGFSITSGEVGYLRESYGSGISAIGELFPESFADECFSAEPAGCLIVVEGPQYADVDFTSRPFVALDEVKRRLPAAHAKTRQRYAREDPDLVREVEDSFSNFVALAEQKLAEGRKVWVYNSY